MHVQGILGLFQVTSLLNSKCVFMLTLCTVFNVCAQTPQPTNLRQSLLSGNAFLSPAMQNLQKDASANPVSLWLEQGKSLWGSSNQRSECFQCHGDVLRMKGAATQFPKWSPKYQKLINLEDQILLCSERTSRPLKGLENAEVLSLSALLHEASQGLPFAVAPNPSNQKQWQAELNAGGALFTTRIGRMNLACTHCHDQQIGKQMRADVISPGHPTGFPIFKMSWQSMGSLDRRLRACYSGVQAEVPKPGSAELRQLELFLKIRSQELPVEGPSLRR
jgi:sulfur-oxidizing protein SoxA